MDASPPDITLDPKANRLPPLAQAVSASKPGVKRGAMRAPKPRALVVLAAVLLAAVAGGCRLTPQTDRDWAPELSRSATADFDGSVARVHNVRNSNYRSDTDFDLRYEDRVYDLAQLDSVDYILVPLAALPKVAHTFISFGFHGREYLAISIEVRRLRGQPFNPVYNFLNENEIIYIAGDERDLIRLRSNFRKDDVYVYRAKLTHDQCRGLFVDMLQRANKLSGKPEFYNTLTNNCETNLIAHLNHVLPQKIPYGYEVLFPGLSDKLLYNLALIKSSGTFEETRTAARINRMAESHQDSPDFSQQIRRF